MCYVQCLLLWQVEPKSPTSANVTILSMICTKRQSLPFVLEVKLCLIIISSLSSIFKSYLLRCFIILNAQGNKPVKLRPCLHGNIFDWKRKLFFMVTHFVYTKMVKTRKKMHENVFTSKMLSKVESFENVTNETQCKHRKRKRWKTQMLKTYFIRHGLRQK